ncbi:DUF2191 domain-containing protein [Leucothrix pacifica]|uniref:DUF2191 domain-containing protein n=1 Tax=Leucothrix pacifica TaxID=1247513 RepID=A0A317CQA8_9GAMM|nr:DUF2191 domain-containing protein [Leucothrix pacifica]PWR00707.1 DUF2191 domain-containing protein [Leucothrix pacifica]
MRTTLTIDDALAEALKKKAYETGKSFKQIVNETLLNGLSGGEPQQAKLYQLKTMRMGTVSAGYNLDKALDLADELEDMAIKAKLELRK